MEVCNKITDPTPAQAKEQATIAYVGKMVESLNKAMPDWSHSRASQAAHQVLRTGSRCAALANACKSVEVILLIQECVYSPEPHKSVGYVIDHGTNEEFQHLRSSLLEPHMNFTEDIFRLDGLVRLIENLGFSESQSDLRVFLSNEIQELLQLWPESTEGLVWPQILKQGEHFYLDHDWDVNAVFGIHINILPAGSDIGQSVAAAAADVGLSSPPINIDDILMQDEDYNTLFNTSLTISPLTSSALWSGEGL
jgi:hypothetical protein